MTANPFTLGGRTVLVVGASSGIGAATAALASEMGAHVVLASRTMGRLEEVRVSLPRPDNARSVAMDYLDPASVAAGLADVYDIDHVLVSAVADENKKRGPFLELPEGTMRASFDKFWGQVNVARAAVPKMTERGSITLLSSIAALSPSGPESGLSVMNGVQAAIIQAATGRSLARDRGEDVGPEVAESPRRRVNPALIAPGVVLTNVWSRLGWKGAPSGAKSRARGVMLACAGWSASHLPVKRTGEPEHVASRRDRADGEPPPPARTCRARCRDLSMAGCTCGVQ